MEYLKLILLLPIVLLVFNIVIVVHELGHFLAARWRGLYVDRFAIWFGKPLWKKKIGGVTYILGRIPAGGYVSVPQLAPMEMVEGRLDMDPEIIRHLPPAKPWDKIIVAIAGPLFSLGLAFFFACLVYIVGVPSSKSNTTTVIGYVEEGSPAADAGLQIGDKVLTVDGHQVRKFFSSDRTSIFWNIIDSKGETVDIVVERAGNVLPPITVKPEIEPAKFYQRDNFKQIGISPEEQLIVGGISENSPAQAAGLQVGDELVSVDGIRMLSGGMVGSYIQANPGKTLELEVVRRANVDDASGQRLTLSALPEAPVSGLPDEMKDRRMLGLAWAEDRWVKPYDRPNPVTQVKDSAMMVVNTVKALTNKHSGVNIKHLSGPAGIVRVYSRLLELEEGWRLVLWFSVVLNVNLAIMNMLPFPVLDGGHITMSLIEIITRRPINVRVLEVLQTGFAVVLISFMLFVTFYDVQDYAPTPEREELRFAPKSGGEPGPSAAPASP